MSNIYNQVCIKMSELVWPDVCVGVEYCEAPYFNKIYLNKGDKIYTDDGENWWIKQGSTIVRQRYAFPFLIKLHLSLED